MSLHAFFKLAKALADMLTTYLEHVTKGLQGMHGLCFRLVDYEEMARRVAVSAETECLHGGLEGSAHDSSCGRCPANGDTESHLDCSNV